MPSCLLAVGSNLGDRPENIRQAIVAIEQLPETSLAAQSQLRESPSVGGPAGQPDFLNGALRVETQLTPHELLAALQEIEGKLGRVRGLTWGPRPIDLDLLLYDDQVLETPELVLPHPRMSFRPFVLEPAAEIAGDWNHPLLDCKLSFLWERLHGGDDYLLLYGGAPPDRDWLAGMLANRFPRMLPESAAEYSLPTFEKIEDRVGAACWLRMGNESLQISPVPKLSIFLGTSHQRPLPGLPTLTLTSSSRDESLADAYAAVELVWPELSRSGLGR